MRTAVKRNILLNPGPATTTDSVKLSQVVPDICPREKEFTQFTCGVANKLLRVVRGGSDYSAVMFGGSGTAAMEAVISSVVPQDKAILVIVNGAYGNRMAQIAEIYGIKTFIYELPWDKLPVKEEIQEIFVKNSGQISHVAMVHHETTTGLLNPIEEIADLAFLFGVEIIVDAMSSYAGIPIDIESLRIDHLIASSNKCLQGMAGISFVISRIAALKRLDVLPVRSLYLNLFKQYESFSQTGQFLFTPPVQTLYALDCALDEYFQEGGKKRALRYQENYATLIDGLQSLGFSFYLPFDLHSKLLISVNLPDKSAFSFEEMHDWLYAKGYTIYPGKINQTDTFRIAVIGEIKPSDITAFLHELKAFMLSCNAIHK